MNTWKGVSWFILLRQEKKVNAKLRPDWGGLSPPYHGGQHKENWMWAEASLVVGRVSSQFQAIHTLTIPG